MFIPYLHAGTGHYLIIKPGYDMSEGDIAEIISPAMIQPNETHSVVVSSVLLQLLMYKYCPRNVKPKYFTKACAYLLIINVFLYG